MGFLDDVRKNIENAVEDVKDNVADAFNLPGHENNDAPAEAQAEAQADAPAEAPVDAAPAEAPVDAAPVEVPAEAAPAEPVAEPAVPAREYTVVSGDTLSGIAAAHGVDLGALIAANSDTIPDPDLIYPGQVVRLP